MVVFRERIEEGEDGKEPDFVGRVKHPYGSVGTHTHMEFVRDFLGQTIVTRYAVYEQCLLRVSNAN